MKAASLLPLLFLAANAAPKVAPRTVTWDDVHAYMVANATSYSQSVETALYNESLAHRKTWKVKPGTLVRDGGSLGWPAPAQSLGFGSYSDAAECGQMIDAFRMSLR